MSPIQPLDTSGVSGLVRAGDSGKAVLFLHGIGSNAGSFRPLFEHWPAGPTLVAWDAPGYGASLPLSVAWPLAADYAAAFAAWLDSLAGIIPAGRQVDLVGHSLGCLMAGAFARAHPARVRRLVMMAPALGYGIAHGGVLPDGIAGRIADLERLGPEAFAAERAPKLVHDPIGNPAVAAQVRAAMAAIRMPGYGQAARMLASGDLLADAAHWRCPVLIVNGAEDAVTPVDGARQLLATLAARASGPENQASIDVIANAGHAVSFDQTDAVLASITGFLEAVP